MMRLRLVPTPVWLVPLLACCLCLFANPQTSRPAESPSGADGQTLVTVVDAETKQPLAGASVLWPADADHKSAKTNEAGQAAVPWPAHDFNPLVIRAQAPGHVLTEINFYDPVDPARHREHFPAECTVAMPRGITVGGVIVGEDGKPADGAIVKLMAEPFGGWPGMAPPGKQWSYLNLVEVTTDEDGRWSTDMAPPQWNKFFVQASHPRYAPHRGLQGITDVDALRAGTARVSMEAGRTLTGEVVDAQGDPVEGARIWSANRNSASDPVLVTDAQGRFGPAEVWKGLIFVTALADGHAPASIALRPGVSAEGVRLTLGPVRPFEVEVVDDSGKPVQALVSLDGTKDSPLSLDSVWRQQTNEAGKLTIQLPEQPMLMKVWAYPHLSQELTVNAAESGSIRVVLERMPFFIATAMDTDTGAPIRPKRVLFAGYTDKRIEQIIDQVPSEPGRFGAYLGQSSDRYALRVEADGYESVLLSDIEAEDGRITADIRLTPRPNIEAAILDAAGRPAEGVSVCVIDTIVPGIYYDLDNFSYDDRIQASAKSGGDGRFSFPAPAEASDVVMVGASGFAKTRSDALERGDPIRLTPWARLEGVLTLGGKAATGISVATTTSFADRLARMQANGKADEGGRFAVSAIAPGDQVISHPIFNNGQQGVRRIISFEAGKTNAVEWHGTATVSGRVAMPEGLSEGARMEAATLSRPAEQASESVSGAPRTVLDKPTAQWPVQLYTLPLDDGDFTFGPIEPGRYLLTLSAGVPATGWACALGMPAARTQMWVELRDGGSLDLGEIVMERVPRPEVGDVAPPISAKTLDGKPFELTDSAGKVIVLDFWATWCAPCIADLPHMRALRDAYAADDRVVIVSLSLDQVVDEAAEYVAKGDMSGEGWRHAHIGLASEVAQKYGVPSIPSVWVIAPDGRIIARDLKAADVAEVVRKALSER